MQKTDKLNWDDLRYFVCAAKFKTLAGTARSLNVEHSTVGRRLSALERSLGAPLFIRGSDGLQLTPLAESLLPLAEQVDRAVMALSDHATQQKVRVRLAMPTGFTKLFTPGLAQLRAQHPELSLELLSESRIVDLKKGEADIAIRAAPVLDGDMVTRKLGESGWSLYASPAYLAGKPEPVDLSDLSNHIIIGYAPSLANSPPGKWMAQYASKASVALRSREMTDMVSAALGGAGLAMLPCFLGDEEPGLRRVTKAVLASREIRLVYRREVRLAEPVRAIIRFVIGVMQDNAERIAGTTTAPAKPDS
jgi:DNA-binding transcriptional LysR family regulator